MGHKSKYWFLTHFLACERRPLNYVATPWQTPRQAWIEVLPEQYDETEYITHNNTFLVISFISQVPHSDVAVQFKKLLLERYLLGYYDVSVKRRWISPDSKVSGANMGPIWGRQGPGGPHVGFMNFVIRVIRFVSKAPHQLCTAHNETDKYTESGCKIMVTTIACTACFSAKTNKTNMKVCIELQRNTEAGVPKSANPFSGSVVRKCLKGSTPETHVRLWSLWTVTGTVYTSWVVFNYSHRKCVNMVCIF